MFKFCLSDELAYLHILASSQIFTIKHQKFDTCQKIIKVFFIIFRIFPFVIKKLIFDLSAHSFRDWRRVSKIIFQVYDQQAHFTNKIDIIKSLPIVENHFLTAHWLKQVRLNFIYVVDGCRNSVLN